MSRVREVLAPKGSQVFSIGPKASVLDAAVLMNEHKIGSLVVLDEGKVIGIFTERDVLRRVVGRRVDPAITAIAEVMSADVLCCTLDTTLDEARTVMKDRRIRHLPVIDENERLIGMLSIGDINAHKTTTQEQTIHHLNEYLYGRV